MDRAAGSPTTSGRGASTARRSRGTAPTRRSRSSTRTTASARTTSAGSGRASARRPPTSSASSPTSSAPSTSASRWRSSAPPVRRSSSSSRSRRTPCPRTRSRTRSAGRRRVIYTSSVAATDTFLTLARSSGGGDLVDKTFTVQYLKDPASPTWDNDAAMKLYKQVMAKYRPGGRVTDGLNYYGVAVAHAYVQLMYKAGRNPTRAALMRAFRNWNETNPFLLPGNRQRRRATTSSRSQCERIVEVRRTARSRPCRSSSARGRPRRRPVCPTPSRKLEKYEGRERSRPSLFRRARAVGTAASTAPSASGAWSGGRGHPGRR